MWLSSMLGRELFGFWLYFLNKCLNFMIRGWAAWTKCPAFGYKAVSLPKINFMVLWKSMLSDLSTICLGSWKFIYPEKQISSEISMYLHIAWLPGIKKVKFYVKSFPCIWNNKVRLWLNKSFLPLWVFSPLP